MGNVYNNTAAILARQNKFLFEKYINADIVDISISDFFDEDDDLISLFELQELAEELEEDIDVDVEYTWDGNDLYAISPDIWGREVLVAKIYPEGVADIKFRSPISLGLREAIDKLSDKYPFGLVEPLNELANVTPPVGGASLS